MFIIIGVYLCFYVFECSSGIPLSYVAGQLQTYFMIIVQWLQNVTVNDACVLLIKYIKFSATQPESERRVKLVS